MAASCPSWCNQTFINLNHVFNHLVSKVIKERNKIFVGFTSDPYFQKQHLLGQTVSAFYLFYTEKLCTSAPRDAEGVKGQTNIPFCIELHALSNGHVRFIVATNPNFNMTPENFAENLKFSNFF